MSDKPYIPLSELRKLWKMSEASFKNYAPKSVDIFRGYVHDELQRRRIKALETENKTLSATLSSTERRLSLALDSSIAAAIRVDELEAERGQWEDVPRNTIEYAPNKAEWIICGDGDILIVYPNLGAHAPLPINWRIQRRKEVDNA